MVSLVEASVFARLCIVEIHYNIVFLLKALELSWLISINIVAMLDMSALFTTLPSGESWPAYPLNGTYLVRGKCLTEIGGVD